MPKKKLKVDLTVDVIGIDGKNLLTKSGFSSIIVYDEQGNPAKKIYNQDGNLVIS